MRLLDLVAACDNGQYERPFVIPGTEQRCTMALVVDGQPVGVVHPALEEWIAQASSVFTIDNVEHDRGYPKSMHFAKHLTTSEERSKALADVLAQWREHVKQAGPDSASHAVLKPLLGWRDELYAIYGERGRVLFTIERSAAGLFGLKTYGAHMTGYVVAPDGGMQVWVARRSFKKPTFPGMLDNTVAGGITYGDTPRSCIIRECMEEASIPVEIASKVQATGAISYVAINHLGICPEVQYVFDLQMPPPSEFQPAINDNEVHGFTLLSTDECMEKLRAGEFKPNCAVVLIDFLMRHDVITPENEPDYLELVARAHRRLNYPQCSADYCSSA
ncbi:hypothetical protein RI367_003736 [Sorochytrium milnesiophthora]